MGTVRQAAQAGTIESSDILITLSPAEAGSGIQIDLVSPTLKQYGERMKAVIRKTLLASGMEDVQVNANDKGALDYTIEARTLTAIERSAGGR